MKNLLLSLLVVATTGVACADASLPVQTKVTAVLTAQAAAWNRGDLDAFMAGYAPLADLRFASGGNVTRGWQPTLERYHKSYPDKTAMGTLAFTDLEITVLAPD